MNSTATSDGPVPTNFRPALMLGRLAAVALSVSLFWDFSWESTVGVDRFWAPPHTLTYLAMMLAVVGAALRIKLARGQETSPASLQFGPLTAPAGAWLVLWGGAAFLTAVLWDRWWQSAYGLGAGIWHPPQILKAVAFFVTLLGVWPARSSAENNFGVAGGTFSPLVGGALLALIGVVTVTQSYANRQHSATFHQLACATYPLVLAALARGGAGRWPATTAALIYFLIVAGLVWLLPLLPARPLTGPVYQPLERLMPPPFPLLLVLPGFAMDVLLRKIRWPEKRGVDWLQAGALGLAFFLLFLIAQWIFAGFLLSPSADHWFFAGGGKHWPFFLKISPQARTAFWESGADVMTGANALRALGLALLATRLGLWLGAWWNRRKQ